MSRPSHPLAVAYLALFVALGGTTYAAATITGKDVLDGSLTGEDLKNGTIQSPDIKGVTGADLGPGAAWTLRSPDKRFSVGVSDAGVVSAGPGGKVTIDASGVTVEGTSAVNVRSSGPIRVGGSITRIGNGDNCRPDEGSTTVFVCG